MWFAAVGAVVGGPVGYLIAHLTGSGEFVWPALVTLVLANVGAMLARPGWPIAPVTGTGMGLVYLVAAILGSILAAQLLMRMGLDYALHSDVGFWSLTVAFATLCTVTVAWWITREQRMW